MDPQRWQILQQEAVAPEGPGLRAAVVQCGAEQAVAQAPLLYLAHTPRPRPVHPAFGSGRLTASVSRAWMYAARAWEWLDSSTAAL